MEDNSTALVAKSGSTTASKLLRSEKYSDLTIVCQERKFKVHKAILCPQSDVMSKLCDSDMLERRTGIIEHKEFDADTMERMIDYAYKKEYDVTRRPRYEPAEDVEDSIASIGSLAIEDAATTGGVTLPQDDADAPMPGNEPAELSTTDKLIVHARVYGLADYYDMEELRDHACRSFMSVADYELEDTELKGFDNVAREVCRTTTRSDGSVGNSYESPLRSGFLSLVALYAPKLANDGNFAAALYEPDLQEMFADAFCALGKRIGELEQERDVNTSTLEAEKEALEQSLAVTKRNADSQIATAQREQRSAEKQFEHTEGVMERLVTSLSTLPESCANSHCSNEWGSLTFEQKGNGEWQRFFIKTSEYRTSAFYNGVAVPFGGNRPKSCSRLQWDVDNKIHLEWRED